jgi:hypothetical protein
MTVHETLPQNFVTKQKKMFQRQSRKEQHHFCHPFLHNEMVAPQVSMGEHTKGILTLLSSGNVKF